MASADALLLAEDLAKVADLYEPRLIAEFHRAVSSVSNSAQFTQLADMVSDPFTSPDDIADLIDTIGLGTQRMRGIVATAFYGSGNTTVQNLGVGYSFDMSNPRAVDVARTHGSSLVTGLNTTMRDGLKDAVASAVQGGEGKRGLIKWLKSHVGLLPAHVDAVDNYRSRLQVTGRAKAQAVAKYERKLLDYRAELIARTEIMRAVSLGQQEAWQQNKDDGLLDSRFIREWVTAKDERTCPLCRPMNGETAPIEGEFDTPVGSVMYPSMIHPQCRCVAVLALPEELEAEA